MPTKFQLITELYDQTVQSVTGSYQSWTGFLRAACYNYKCPFDEQLLIYAQRPDATAVLEMERWNRQFGRWVNRGAKSIAVFGDDGQNCLKLYFDVSDTHASRFARPLPIWTMHPAFEPEVIETLEATFGNLAEKENLADAVRSACHNAVADNFTDYLQDLRECREDSLLEELDDLNLEVFYLEFNGQIVTFEVQNTSVSTGVSIKKTGPVQAVPGQPIRYVFSQIKNSSNVVLDSFYWRDQLPAQVTLSKIVTGSYNQPLSYKVVYKTNLSGDYRTLADNLSTSKVYVLDARPAVLGLAANERVTEVMFVFGNVKAGFAQVETPYIYATARSGLANNSSIVNVADVGGLYNGQWIQAVSHWLTTVYTKTTVKLPKTGY